MYSVIKWLDKILKACGRNGFYPVQPMPAGRVRELVVEPQSLEYLGTLDEIYALENQLQALTERKNHLLEKAALPTASDDKRTAWQLQAAGLETRAVRLSNKIQSLWDKLEEEMI